MCDITVKMTLAPAGRMLTWLDQLSTSSIMSKGEESVGQLQAVPVSGSVLAPHSPASHNYWLLIGEGGLLQCVRGE